MSSGSINPPVTSALARYVVGARFNEFPPEVLLRVRSSLVDTIGATIAARNEIGVKILQSLRPPMTTRGVSTVIFDGARTDMLSAALLNGTAGHALDYDDVSDTIYGHPSVVLWSAALAVAESMSAPEHGLFEAFLVGYAVEVAIASGLDVRQHYRRGWHSTATIGALGAAAVAAKLLDLHTMQVQCAFGIAASLASGSRQNFGTMTKPLHAGLAAHNGILAATLASKGFTADLAELEAPLGFFARFGGGERVDGVIAALNSPWALTEHGLNVKKYPCCYNTHRSIDAVLELRNRHGIVASEVQRVVITLEPGGLDPLIYARPTNGIQGKFSCEYAVAAALLDGRIGLSSFTDEAVMRPEVQDLLARVVVKESALPPVGPVEWEHSFAVAHLETNRGMFESRVDVPRGDRRAPLDRDELDVKFHDCIAFSNTAWDADLLLSQLWAMGGGARYQGLRFQVSNGLLSP